MKVLFVPWGTATHYFHMVPLAWACRVADHEVRVAGHASAAGIVTGTGMTHIPVAEGHDFDAEFAAMAKKLREKQQHRALAVEHAAELSAEDRDSVHRMRIAPFVSTAEAMAADLVRVAELWRPDLVIADPMVLAAPLAARVAGAPLLHHLWGPALLRVIGVPGCGTPVERWGEDLLRLYARFGVEPQAESAVGAIDSSPENLQVPGVPDRIPIRYVPYNGSGSAPDWLSRPAERPRVCVTWGTTTTEKTGPEDFVIPRILQALEQRDLEVVVAVGRPERELIGAVPPNVRLVEGLPLNLLLPTCDAVVHHGGTGTMLTAAAAAVPQVLIVSMGHYRLNAGQLEGTGAGTTVGIEDVTADRVTSAVTTALSEEAVREAARDLREAMRAHPTPAEVVGTLTDLC